MFKASSDKLCVSVRENNTVAPDAGGCGSLFYECLMMIRKHYVCVFCLYLRREK